jgi:D-serine deaminase-like pyridoxal phosphate-dependent protein
MSSQKCIIGDFSWDEKYRLSDISEVLTPALLLYPEIIASNINCTLQLLGGNADRWRVHIKTAKLGYTLRILLQHGVRYFKCATTLELLTGCESGAADVLVAYPVMGANARRVREIAHQFPAVRISVLAENKQQIHQWTGTEIGIHIDINPGMNRTGIDPGNAPEVVQLIRAIHESEIEFRGLHYYDGQYGHTEEPQRSAAAHSGYDRLMELIAAIDRAGFRIPELVTAGTPTFPSSLSYKAFQQCDFLHRVSPGTVVYCDATSMAQLPPEYGYAPAGLVLTRVVSHPSAAIVTCDAGHKSVSADAGVPTCVVMGHPELTPLSPSEEHLPMQVSSFSKTRVGDSLYLIPRHVCPTVNNFDDALMVRNGRIESVEKVSARGREISLLQPANDKGTEVILQSR